MEFADSRALLEFLSATSSQEAWRRGVDELRASLEALTLACESGWSDIVNRRRFEASRDGYWVAMGTAG